MKLLLYLTSFLFSIIASAQSTFPEVLKKLNKGTVPYIKVGEIKIKHNTVFLDAREPKEFNVSHIENAILVGFNKFDGKRISTTIKDKNETIIVYCSIGVRSEIIVERLQKLGYKNVFNLYGGIFEWKNQDGKIVNNKKLETDEVHTYNKEWSIYLKKGTKVYEN